MQSSNDYILWISFRFWTFTLHSFTSSTIWLLLFLWSPLFCYFSLITTITFSLIALFHLLLVHPFSLVFIDFALFKFYFCSSTSSMLFLWFSLVFCFLFLFEHFFLDFLVVFYLLMPFLWISCCWWLFLFFLGNFWPYLCSVIVIFFYNVISS